jgi:hypothetical protein
VSDDPSELESESVSFAQSSSCAPGARDPGTAASGLERVEKTSGHRARWVPKAFADLQEVPVGSFDRRSLKATAHWPSRGDPATVPSLAPVPLHDHKTPPKLKGTVIDTPVAKDRRAPDSRQGRDFRGSPQLETLSGIVGGELSVAFLLLYASICVRVHAVRSDAIHQGHCMKEGDRLP